MPKPLPSEVRAVRKADRRAQVFGGAGRAPGRLEARRQIVEAANKARSAYSTRRFNMRQLGECVHIVRKRALVPVAVITAAGFRAVAR